MLEVSRRVGRPAREGALWGDELARTVALFVESFAFLHKLGSPSPIGIISGLAGFAALAFGQGQLARAARLYGAAEAVRTAGGVGLAPVACAECERHTAALRQQLDPTTFAVAWAEGQAMTREVAIAYALEVALSSNTVLRSSTIESIEALTPRELEILRLIAEGLSNQKIAGAVHMSVGTIKWYTGQIYSKLQVHSRTQAIARARDLDLLL